MYVPKGQELTAETRAVAARLWSGRNATAAGLSAAALHGSNWIDAALPAELIRSVPCKVVGISIHRETLGDHEACVVRGIQATTAAESNANATASDSSGLSAAANADPGLRRVRYLIGRVDMGWTKWKVGVEYDGLQHWTDPKRHVRDIDRLAELQAEGWIIIRVSRDILRYRPEVFLARVRDAMRVGGWPDYGQVRLDARLKP